MKILFSVYKEDRDTDKRTLIYRKIVETNKSLKEIDDILQLYDGFHSTLESGSNLTFWDIYCFFDISQDIIEKIDTIPLSGCIISGENEAKVFWIEEYDPGNTDAASYPDESKYFLYQLSRFECGASSFEAMVLWASNHPWLMVFIGGFIWDISKIIVSSVFKTIRKVFGIRVEKEYVKRRKKLVAFDSRKFYDNFSKMININKYDCQIVSLNRIKSNRFEVYVRTNSYEYYEVKCTCRGNIISLNILET